jgi:hypothetical protein
MKRSIRDKIGGGTGMKSIRSVVLLVAILIVRAYLLTLVDSISANFILKSEFWWVERHSAHHLLPTLILTVLSHRVRE